MEHVQYESYNGEILKGYKWPADGGEPKANLIIVTGMAECAYRYTDFATFLNHHGYDVYCFDHYGQGDNVEDLDKLGIVPPSFFSNSVKNIDIIVNKLRVTCKPTYIFAHSMGSFMLQDYIQRFTKHVNKVVICGSNGPNARFLFWGGYQFAKLVTTKKNRDQKSPLLDNLVIGAYKKSVKNRENDNDWLSVNKENVANYNADPKNGFLPTYGFYYEFLKGLNRIFKRKFVKKIRNDMSVLVIAGSDDPVGAMGKGPHKLAKMYAKLGLDRVEEIIYEGGRHEILNDFCKDEVYKDVLAFLDEEGHAAEVYQQEKIN